MSHPCPALPSLLPCGQVPLKEILAPCLNPEQMRRLLTGPHTQVGGEWGGGRVDVMLGLQETAHPGLLQAPLHAVI
jgi:hypothetical protein